MVVEFCPTAIVHFSYKNVRLPKEKSLKCLDDAHNREATLLILNILREV